MAVVTLSSKGQLVIPKEIRNALGIKIRQKLLLKVVKDHLELEPLPEDPVEYLCGIFKEYPGSLAGELLRMREEDSRREEEKGSRFARHPGLPQARGRVPRGQGRAQKGR